MTSQPLDDSEEVLFRQIHPNFYDNSHPGSGQFAPSAKHDNKLSVDRSSRTTAAAGVSVAEFSAEHLPCYSDPLTAKGTLAANSAHAYADFSLFGTSQSKKIAKRLRNNAVKRGRLHP